MEMENCPLEKGDKIIFDVLRLSFEIKRNSNVIAQHNSYVSSFSSPSFWQSKSFNPYVVAEKYIGSIIEILSDVIKSHGLALRGKFDGTLTYTIVKI